ncbi:MAG: hypothetical protein ACJAXX_001554 [Roseivirga sp.]|jgi:hypothetical protein
MKQQKELLEGLYSHLGSFELLNDCLLIEFKIKCGKGKNGNEK